MKHGSNALRPGLPPLPDRIKSLPIDERGYPVPKFVKWIDGKPEFRVADGRFLVSAYRDQRCWICGNVMGKFMSFVVGPMCTVNRTSAEPPSHLDCALFAVKACPFIVLPKAKRREANMPSDADVPAGIMIERNPGVACVWTVKKYTLFLADPGVLFNMGQPVRVQWFCQGREATRDEVMYSLLSGMPLLAAEAKKGGPEDVAALESAFQTALTFLPAKAA